MEIIFEMVTTVLQIVLKRKDHIFQLLLQYKGKVRFHAKRMALFIFIMIALIV